MYFKRISVSQREMMFAKFNKDFFFKLPILLVISFLVCPFVVFLWKVSNLSWPHSWAFLEPLAWTFFQAFFSTGIVIGLAFFGARGLSAFSNKKYYFLLEALSLSPSLLPPLILVTSVVNLFEVFYPFPFGLWALIGFQVLTYTGLCSVILARTFSKELSSLSEWAYLHQLSWSKFLYLSIKSLLKKDVITLAALIFVATFTSLSLPLLTAGGKAISLEFFIYEQLKDPTHWSSAISLILFQSIFVFVIYYFAFLKSFGASFHFHSGTLHLLKNKKWSVIPFLFSFLSFAGLFFIRDFKMNFQKLIALKTVLWESLIHSLMIGLGVGMLTLLFLILVLLSFQNKKARQFLVAYHLPSVTLLGFVFLILPFYSQNFILLKWILGLSLLFFPLVYRLRGELLLKSLEDQVEVASLLGASNFLIFYKILWPQSRSTFLFCSGLAGFLACGHFSYSLIVSQGHWNLALFVYDLLNSYRLDLAVLASWVLLLFSFMILIFWLGLGFVFDKKFKL